MNIERNAWRPLAAAIITVAIALSAQPSAQATAVIGATEPTQILNNIELVAQYQNDVDRALTQVRQYTALAQQLKNMPDSVKQQLGYSAEQLKNFNDFNISDAMQLQSALEQSRQATSVIKQADGDAYKTLGVLKAQGTNMTVEQYESGMAVLAQEHADTYGKELASYKQAISDQQQASEQIAQIDQNAPNITSEVGGLQSVIHTNAILSRQLATINTTLSKNAMVTAQSAQDAASKIADERLNKKCSAAATAQLFGAPDPSMWQGCERNTSATGTVQQVGGQ
ncbi:hypothetical protein AB7849_15345 [Rhodanobacter sp. 115]|uniref:hypothetical protein n=1 Tax=Rhodanobacter sp. FW021-MT20 TaxID=1162282 RepID=UPI0034E5EB5F